MWSPIKKRISNKWAQLWETQQENFLREENNNLELMKIKQQKNDLIELENLKLELKEVESKADLETLQTKIQLIHSSLTVVTNVTIDTDIKNENTSVININNENANTNNNRTSSSSKSNAKARADDANYYIGG